MIYRTICAWCTQLLNLKRGHRVDAPKDAVNHGICKRCEQAFLVEAGQIADEAVWQHWQDVGGEG